MVPRIFITLFSLLIIFSGAGASDGKFCINDTEAQVVKKNYSINIKQATDRAGWTWVKSEWDGDKWPLDTIQSPVTGLKTSMPELYYQTCSYWQNLWGDCRFAGSTFSRSTGIAFIQGNEKNIFGFEMPKSYAVYGDTVIELPSNFQKTTKYRGDVNALGYAALRGLKEEFILFNGDESITLNIPEATPRKDSLPPWRVSNDINTGRSFVLANSLKGVPMFLYEVYNGSDIRKIDLDPNMKGWLKVLSEFGTKQMFIIDRYGIYAEVDKAFKRIVHLPEPNYIYGPANLGYTKDNEIYFEIMSNDKTKTSYVLQSRSNTDNCGTILSLNKDIMLKNK